MTGTLSGEDHRKLTRVASDSLLPEARRVPELVDSEATHAVGERPRGGGATHTAGGACAWAKARLLAVGGRRGVRTGLEEMWVGDPQGLSGAFPKKTFEKLDAKQAEVALFLGQTFWLSVQVLRLCG